jgi:uncharacterized membrane protein
VSPSLMAFFMAVSVLCCGIFAGAAIDINGVEHPARIECGTAVALSEWAPSYRRATLMQAPLAIVGGLSAIALVLAGADRAWLVGGLLLLSVAPVTLLVIMPTNRALSAPQAAQDLPRTAALLIRWNRLHAIRTALSTVAFLLFIWLLVAHVPPVGAP